MDQLKYLITRKNNMIIIKFSATWCMPCKAYTPVFLDTVKKFPTIIAAEVDLEKDPDKGGKYKVMAVPTTIIEWDDWEILFRESGPLSAEKLTEEIEKHFKI